MGVYFWDLRKRKCFFYLVIIAFLLAISKFYLLDTICCTSGKLSGWTLLSQYSTPVLSTDLGREHNLKMGVATINNQFLEEGTVFSFNQRNGPYTEELGWRNAKNSMVMGAELMDSIGGGVCQITATLYNAVLLADLEIEERHPHNVTPKYVEPGRDCAVWYEGDLDFAFRNNKKFALIIKAKMEDKKVMVEIWGKGLEAKKWKQNHQVNIYLDRQGEIAYQQLIVKDENLTYGKKYVEVKGAPGYNKVTLEREVLKDGKREKREIISVDKYLPLQERVKLGTNKSLQVMGRLWFFANKVRFREN